MVRKGAISTFTFPFLQHSQSGYCVVAYADFAVSEKLLHLGITLRCLYAADFRGFLKQFLPVLVCLVCRLRAHGTMT